MEYAFYSLDNRTILQRAVAKFFPESPFPELKDDDSALSTEVVCHLSFADRIRILISGKCSIKTRTYTDVKVDKAFSESTFSVISPLTRVK